MLEVSKYTHRLGKPTRVTEMVNNTCYNAAYEYIVMGVDFCQNKTANVDAVQSLGLVLSGDEMLKLMLFEGVHLEGLDLRLDLRFLNIMRRRMGI